MIPSVLAACSSGDLIPPGSVDTGTQVGAITPVRNLPREPASQQAYMAPPAPVAQASLSRPDQFQANAADYANPQGARRGSDAYTGDSGHYLRLPDQPSAQTTSAQSPYAQSSYASQPAMQQASLAPPASAARQGRLPMIDSPEALGSGRRQPAASGQHYSNSAAIPQEGVNIDAELGFGPDESGVTGLAEEQDTDIAEGVGSQPVVDGIGTDNPRALNPRRPANGRAAAQPMATQQMVDDRVIVPPKRSGAGSRGDDGIGGDYANGSMTWSDGSRVRAPSRAPPNSPGAGTQQVAMMRPNNPMSAPANDGPMSQRDQPWLREAMPQSELSCRAELRRLGVQFEDRPGIHQGPSCGIDYPVKLSGLSGNIAVQPGVTLNCQTTLAFAKWVRNELAPASRLRYLVGVQKIVPMGGYSCRRMNNSSQRYNPMSEHAKGNAIDIGQIVLKDGHEIDVRKKGFFSMREGALLKSVRSDSCKYFNTVLGPGSNAEHWNHFHFDLRSRRSGGRYCS